MLSSTLPFETRKDPDSVFLTFEICSAVILATLAWRKSHKRNQTKKYEKRMTCASGKLWVGSLHSLLFGRLFCCGRVKNAKGTWVTHQRKKQIKYNDRCFIRQSIIEAHWAETEMQRLLPGLTCFSSIDLESPVKWIPRVTK